MNVNKHSLYGPRALDNRITNSANTLGPNIGLVNLVLKDRVNDYFLTRSHCRITDDIESNDVKPSRSNLEVFILYLLICLRHELQMLFQMTS